MKPNQSCVRMIVVPTVGAAARPDAGIAPEEWLYTALAVGCDEQSVPSPTLGRIAVPRARVKLGSEER